MAAKKKSAKKANVSKKAKKTKKKVSPIPKEYGTVTASLKQADASATLDFCKKAFGAKVLSKLNGPAGKIMHAQVLFGDTLVHIADAMQGPATPGGLFLYVPHVDKTVAKAVKAGATIVMPAENTFWGDRYAIVTDPQGNVWEIASRFEIVKADELKKRTKAVVKQMTAEG